MEMAVRASATLRPHPLSSSPSSSSSRHVIICSVNKTCPKPHPSVRPINVSLPASTTLSLFAFLSSSPLDARALTLPKDQIVSSITEVEKTIDQVQEVGSGFFETAQQIFQAVAEALKPAVEVAVPVVQKAGDQALKIASPALSEASKQAKEAMQNSGIDTESVMGAAKTVADAAQQTTKVIQDAKPIASSAVETISSSEPTVIIGAAGALFLTYLILPPIWSLITFNFRGFKGDLTPAQTLDMVCTQNYVMIDIRSEKDKDKNGVPRLPSSVKNKMLAIPLEELPNRVRSLVRNVKKVEAEIVALKISYLKKINKGSNVVILDSYTDSAKIVARTLTNLGFKNCWIVADGFSGRKGWLQSRLGTDSYNFSFAEVLSPSRVIPAAVRQFGTTSSTKLLP